MCKQNAKNLIYTLACVSLAIISCGAPVSASVNMPEIIYTSTQTAANTPVTTAEMTVCHTDTGLHVRPAAGDLSTYSRTLKVNDYALVRIPATATEDMGLWYQLADGSGWVNAKYLCEAE